MASSAAALGWSSVALLLCFAWSFDTICPTMLLFVFEAAALATTELKLRQDGKFMFKAEDVEPVEPLFGLESPSASHTKAALFFYMAGHATRLVLLFMIINPRPDSILWVTAELVFGGAYLYALHAVLYRTRTAFHEPRLRRFVMLFVTAVYAALAVALFVGHLGRDQRHRHYAHDHRLKWAAVVLAFHGLLVFNNGGRFCAPPQREPLLPREWALALNLAGWVMLWLCSGHRTLIGPRGF